MPVRHMFRTRTLVACLFAAALLLTPGTTNAIDFRARGVWISMLEYGNGGQLTLLDGKDVSGDIRTSQVSMLASYVSAYPSVRAKMVSLQREIASRVSCILDGRDIGTNVLPDCLYKFFLTASPEVRAERRFKEDKLKGSTQTYEDILLEINERDAQDRNRAVAPLMCADDAVVIDTSEMTAEEVANTICERIQEKI